MSSDAETRRRQRLQDAFLAACRTELEALKPGNVHVHAPGHGMTVEDFLRSAEAAAAPLCRPGASVGERIREAVDASWAAAACNTNLGIILLAAPILAAAERDEESPLALRLRATLDALTVADAREAYAAIRRANPGGLGRAAAQDVAAPPTVTLLEAMRLAADRDFIARQYATGYGDVFAVGVRRIEDERQRGTDIVWTATLVFLDFLARFPDSHITRKFGSDKAEEVRSEAERVRAALPGSAAESFETLIAFDRSLKRRGLNPGTSADLTVASLLAAEIMGIAG